MLFKNKPLLLLIFGIEIAIGLILAVIGFITNPEEMMDDNTSLQQFFFIVSAVLTIGPIIAMSVLFFISNARSRMTNSLKESGVRGTASVVSVSPILGKLNNLCRIDIVMDVNIPGKIPFRIEHGEYLDIKNIERIKPGVSLNILADPNKLKKLMIIL